MWDGHLRCSIASKHRIKLLENHTKPIYTAPRQAGSQTREFENVEIDEQLNQMVLEEAQTKWSKPIVFSPKKVKTHRFCVDFWKLITNTKRDSYVSHAGMNGLTLLARRKFLHTRRELRKLEDRNRGIEPRKSCTYVSLRTVLIHSRAIWTLECIWNYLKNYGRYHSNCRIEVSIGLSGRNSHILQNAGRSHPPY